MSGGTLAEAPCWAVLLVCHNRRAQTLRAVAALRQGLPTGLRLRIVLFDDRSTDGTADAVVSAWPDALVVQGDGNAFWNKGLHGGWAAALGLPVDGFLWLNDDVVLDGDALFRLLDGWRAMAVERPDGRFILAGATRDAAGRVTYSGRRVSPSPFAYRLALVHPTHARAPIDTFNGNIVLVPRPVVDGIGINDPAYHHNLGDIDYGLRARRAGVSVLLMPDTLGTCELNTAKTRAGYGSAALSLADQWRKVNTHHGLPFASWWRFTGRHSGRWRLLHFLLPYRWLILPRALRRSVARDPAR